MRPYNATILIVEDEPTDRQLIEMAFREIGVTGRIQAVNDGLEAIAYLMGEGPFADRAKFPYPSFIITDLKMPRADGFAVLEHLRNNPEWPVIPAVVLSASSDPDDIQTAYKLGASSYHLKPNGFEPLCKQLKLLHDYWLTCQVPDADPTGKQVRSSSSGKMGQRFTCPPESQQRRVQQS